MNQQPAVPASHDAVRILRRYFFCRVDQVAVLAPWGKPSPTAVDGKLEALLVAHLKGSGAPEVQVVCHTARGPQDLRGRFRIGSYAPAPDGTTRWVCLDFDGGEDHADRLADPTYAATAVWSSFRGAGIAAHLERSGGGQGWHLWCFFEQPIAARKARQLAMALLLEEFELAGGERVAGSSGRGVEIFPKQDTIGPDGSGNMVWLPWWSEAQGDANQFHRLDETGKLVAYAPEQFETVSEAQVDAVLATMTPPSAQADGSALTGHDAHGPRDNGVWREWRRQALEALALDGIYGEWLTGKVKAGGWLECRDPWSAGGDRDPSAGVADGSGQAERGTFHSFISGKSLSVFDFLVARGEAADFRAACQRVAELSGVELPATPETEGDPALIITGLPKDVAEDERTRLLAPILERIASLDPLEQDRYLRLLQEHFGKHALSLTALRAQVRAIERENRARTGGRHRWDERPSTAPEGSCRACVGQALAASERQNGAPDWAQAAEAAYAWLEEHGARFFRTLAGAPFMFCDESIFWMDSSDHGQRRLYNALIYKHTGIVPTTSGGRTFYEVLANLAAERGKVRDQLTWLHTDVSRCTIHFNLNSEEHEIARISPAGVDILKNGGNEDGIILGCSRKLQPIHYLPDADLAQADRLLTELIIDNLTCPSADRFLILSWLSCFLLLDFAGTHPTLRFEGDSDSGKTTAGKLVSALIYGEPQQKRSTDAANYADAAQNPLLVLDNIEARHMTEELTAFMLTCVTGIVREKRKGGTDSETVTERAKCLLNTTGIEPLGGDLSEILSRTFVIRFDVDRYGRDCFLEASVLARLRECRESVLSALMKRTSRALALIQDGALERVMGLLHVALGNHDKRRCNDYLSLMYLMMLAGADAATVSAGLEQIHPRFLEQIRSLNSTTQETARESNAIATALHSLFRAYQRALEADDNCTAEHVVKSNKDAFLERYQIELESREQIRGALARELFVALRRVAREFNLSFAITSVQQFAQRFSNDLPAIREAGFEVIINNLGGRVRNYDIRRQ
jgi:hypothetical protein